LTKEKKEKKRRRKRKKRKSKLLRTVDVMNMTYCTAV